MKMNYLKMTLGVLAAALAVSGCASVEHTDVLVVGGGASGISAAVQTARMGVPVMVVEETPWVGGMLTSAGVSCIDGNSGFREEYSVSSLTLSLSDMADGTPSRPAGSATSTSSRA